MRTLTSIDRRALIALALAVMATSACERPPELTHAAGGPTSSPTAVAGRRQVRATGTVQAENSFTVMVPQIVGQGGRMTLVALIENGSAVKKGDLVAQFDATQQTDNARDARAKYEDLGHQVEQKAAEFRSNAEKRKSDLQKAEADLAKALLQLRRGPLLGDIDRLKNEARADDAKARVESLNKSHEHRSQAEAAAIRILELQRDRQQVSLDRSLTNAEKLSVKAPLQGMVAHEYVWRNGSPGKPQEGDQLFGGQPLIRIFDPSRMVVDVVVGEPDGAALAPGARAKVRLDAYPDLEFDAAFVSASPVAASASGGPIKSFAARFRFEQANPHLLPDLSAAVIIDVKPEAR